MIFISYYLLEKLRQLEAERVDRTPWVELRDPAATRPPVFGWVARQTGRSLQVTGRWLESFGPSGQERERQAR